MNLKIKFCGDFNLDKTLDCGQCFRWNKIGNFWSGVVSEHGAICRVENNVLNIDTSLDDVRFWINYFDISTDYDSIINQVKNMDEFIYRAISENIGIRILNQDIWEVICSFIISQNNNIKRIKKIIYSLCKFFGEYKNGIHTFPPPFKIAHLSIDELNVIKAGFRAKYILDAAKKVSSKEIDFDKIQKLNTNDASKILQKIDGVGPKVSSCVLLYGFHKLDSFPIDTWMKKVIFKFYKNTNQNYFGNYAGIIQQYLFLWSRNHPELFK